MRLNAFSSTDYPPPPSPAKRAVEARVKARVDARVEARARLEARARVEARARGWKREPGWRQERACACALGRGSLFARACAPLNLQTVSYERCSFLLTNTKLPGLVIIWWLD